MYILSINFKAKKPVTGAKDLGKFTNFLNRTPPQYFTVKSLINACIYIDARFIDFGVWELIFFDFSKKNPQG
jgi:hypothetical protein